MNQEQGEYLTVKEIVWGFIVIASGIAQVILILVVAQ